MPNLLALSPLLVLLAAALILPLLPGRGRWAGIAASLAGVTALALLLLAGRQFGGPIIIAGSSAGGDLDLALEFTPYGLLLSSLLVCSFLASLFVRPFETGDTGRPAELVALAGAVLFFSAANVPTLATAWLLVDLALLSWQLRAAQLNDRARPWRGFGLSLVGAMLVLFSAVLLSAEGSSLHLPDLALQGTPALLLILAAWIRTGLYPFHSWMSVANGELRESQWMRALAMLLGLYMLVMVLPRLQDLPAFADALQLLALCSAAATAVLAVAGGRSQPAVRWAALAIGAPLFISTAANLVARSTFVLWFGLGVFNLLVLVSAAAAWVPQTRREPWRQVVWAAALACALGLPLTPGFLARAGFYSAALQSGDYALVVLVTTATTLALIPLWRAFLLAGADASRRPTLLEYAGLGLLLLPPLVEGLIPFQIAAFFGRPAEDAGAAAYDALLHAPTPWQPLALMLLILLPLALAYFPAHRLASREEAPAGNPLLTTALSLSGPGRAVREVHASMAGTLHQLGALIEQYPLGWVLLAAVWVALWLLNVR